MEQKDRRKSKPPEQQEWARLIRSAFNMMIYDDMSYAAINARNKEI